MLTIRKLLIGLSIALASATAMAQAAPPTATLTFVAPTKNTDGTAITAPLTFNIYQGVQATPQVLAKVTASSGGTATTLVITAGLTPGTTQCFSVTAVANAVESDQAPPACVAIPFPKPGAPSQITIVIR